MALYVVATPIGHDEDLSPHALQVLRTADVVIGEEAKETRRLLAKHGLREKLVLSLNEHSRANEIAELVETLQSKSAALISDCGTPGFCDPGPELVKACRTAGIEVRSVAGPSSLATFISVCGERLNDFYFRGFLPANTEERELAYQNLKSFTMPIILMDTPYRLEKTLLDVAKHFGSRPCVVGYNLTQADEGVQRGPAKHLAESLHGKKLEFLLLILADSRAQRDLVRSRKKSR